MRKIRKKECTVSVAAAVIFAAVFVHKKTIKIQDQAKRESRHIPYGAYEALFKRPLDILLSSIALVMFLPIMGVIAVMVQFKLGLPVLFRQQRPGLGEKIFTLYKFRTMTSEKGENGELLPDEKRMTKFGSWLRSTSLDELPELFNIIRGDMSIVGPRPLLVEYLPRYDENQKHRHDVRPGLTGLAQVSGRNGISWEEKFKDDVEYVRRVSFAGDLKIIFRTVGTVLKRSGINSETSVTMEAFMGRKWERFTDVGQKI